MFDEVEPIDGRLVRFRGKEYVQVCSTQYLGMDCDPRLHRFLNRMSQRRPRVFMAGIGSSYLGGMTGARIGLEKWMARLLGSKEAIAFASGWVANYSIGRLLGASMDLVLSDRRNHNSIRVGLQGCAAQVRVVDVEALDCQEFARVSAVRRVGLVFPRMEGISGRLVVPARGVCERVFTVVDECHSFGMLGASGVESGLEGPIGIRVLGLSKAIGCMGAIVSGDFGFVKELRQVAAPWMFSTSVPSYLWRLARVGIRLALTQSERRRRVVRMAEKLREWLGAALGGRVEGDWHITSVVLDGVDSGAFEAALLDAGFYVKVSNFPTVSQGRSVCRLILGPGHSEADCRKLADAVVAVVAALTSSHPRPAPPPSPAPS